MLGKVCLDCKNDEKDQIFQRLQKEAISQHASIDLIPALAKLL